MSEITTRIRSAGYWEIAIHPVTFAQTRIPSVLELFPTIQRCVVEVRGWDFPHIDRNVPAPAPHLDFIQQESEWEHHAERWRLYQSGQFLLLRPYGTIGATVLIGGRQIRGGTWCPYRYR